jgi:hypothetical protein
MPSFEQAAPFFLAAMLALGVWLNFPRIKHSFNAKQRLADHLIQQGLTIAYIHRMWIGTGPFPASGSSGEPIFRLSVLDGGGKGLSGWACCPLPPESIEIKWEEEIGSYKGNDKAKPGQRHLSHHAWPKRGRLRQVGPFKWRLPEWFHRRGFSLVKRKRRPSSRHEYGYGVIARNKPRISQGLSVITGGG